MTREVGLHPAATQELIDAADYYDLESPGLGAAFVDDFERAARDAAQYPEASPIALDPARKKQMVRFPYSVIYSLLEDDVLVVAVAHHRRRPFYWRDRV
jgi:toxin ParE1/3/4